VAVDLIPLEVLFGNPERSSPQISPDGKRLAYLAPVDGVLNVWVGSTSADDAKPVTSDTGRGIRSYGWAHNGTHLFYIQDLNGDENWHLYTVDLSTNEVVNRTPFDGAQAQPAGRSRRKPDELLIGINADDRRFHDLYHLDLPSGRLEKRVKNPGFDSWLVDLDLAVRGGTRTTDTGAIEYLMGEGDPSTWPVVLTVAPEDATLNTSGVLGFDAKGEKLFMLTPVGANATRLVRFDPATGGTEVLVEDPTYDVASVVLHPESHEPQLAAIVRDRSELVVLDPAIAGDIERLKQADAGELHVVSRDHADRRWVVAYVHDDAPITYFIYDRDSGTSTFLFEHQPSLSQHKLAKVEPFSFTASDGLTVHGYAAFPAGSDRKRVPTVVHVHGGPWGARHTWGYDPTTQWLANRGYLVLEINYRGSGGYGKDFLNASEREWAGRMHTDLIEGATYAVEQGWADPNRIAIFGGSYGGYAALVGATFTPDFFRCAVDIVGPSNLITLLETVPPYWVGIKQVFYRLLGHPERDRDFLWERSPLSRVDQIRIPMLIGQGANDPRVNQAESEQIVAAMKERGIDHEYLLFPDEGHGFAKPENRLRFYGAAEDFLAKHMAKS
jgi:dipeptidyl aminopeptidase/acylaminoacyl peptidase